MWDFIQLGHSLSFLTHNIENGGMDNKRNSSEVLTIGVETEIKRMKYCVELLGALHIYFRQSGCKLCRELYNTEVCISYSIAIL